MKPKETGAKSSSLLDWFMSDAMKEVKDVREYRYMRILRFTTSFLCAWPAKELNEKAPKYDKALGYFLVTLKFCAFWANVLYVVRHYKSLSFLQLGHNFIVIFMTVVTMTRVSSLSLRKKYRELVVRFVREMHLSYFRKDSEYAMKTHVRVHKISYFFAIYLNVLLLYGIFLMNMHTLYMNYINGKFTRTNQNDIPFEHPIYYEMPFDKARNLNAYIVVAIFNWYATYICVNGICMLDFMIFVMVFHLRGHFNILIHNLKSFPKPASSLADSGRVVAQNTLLYSADERDGVLNTLKRCIDHHRLLVEFTQQVSEAFGPMLLICYVFHQVSGCLVLLEISQMSSEAFIRFGPLTVGLFQQLITLSIIIESIGTVTHKLKDAVYDVPWEYMDTETRRTLMIFQMKVQEPLHIKAMGMVNVGVETMATILKTSFSYCAILRTMAD